MKKVKIINYNINIKGSNVEGKDVTLDAKENLNVTASETTNKLEQNSKSSSASVGVGFDIVTGQVSSVTISGSKSKGEVDANSTSYNESTVKADKNLDFTSGKDTNIKGGKLSGEKVTGNVGGDLNIESKQDKNSYEEKNSSAGFGIGMPVGDKDSANKIGIFGSAGKSNVDSKYESVTDQSGIYTGKEGFDINVEGNTDIKGGIISSEAEKDKNKISTGTLTYEDIKNKAEYEAGSTGINVDTSSGAEHKDAGVTPNIGVDAKDDAESTTKATVSEGKIEIRDKENQKQDLVGLNRDTKNSINKLGEIFDKTKIEERQELAGLFGEVAFNQIHYMKGTKEQKALYHALVGGIMSKLTSGDFLAGASATAINKLVIGEIEKIAGEDPAMMQWISAALGGVISEVVSKNAEAGAGAASSATKNNDDLDAEQAASKGKSAEAVISAQNNINMVEYDDGSREYVVIPKNSEGSFDWKKSIVTNSTVAVADLPAEIATILYKQGLPKTAEKVGFMISINNDINNYEGKNLAWAVAIDVGAYAVGGVTSAYYGAYAANKIPMVGPGKAFLIVYGGTIGVNVGTSVVGDYISNKVKDAFLEKSNINRTNHSVKVKIDE